MRQRYGPSFPVGVTCWITSPSLQRWNQGKRKKVSAPSPWASSLRTRQVYVRASSEDFSLGQQETMPILGEAGEALLDDVSLRALRRLEGLAEPLMQLSSSARMDALKANIEGASSWKARLAQGLLPNDDTDWPDETFRRALLETLEELDMPRFTRKHPPVTNTLMRNILEMLQEYELQMESAPAEEEAGSEDGEEDEGGGGPQGQAGPRGEEASSEEGEDGEGGDPGQGDADGGSSGDSSGVENMDMSLESNEPQQGEPGGGGGNSARDRAEEIVEELMDRFKEQWEPAVENLEAAEKAFQGLDGLMDGPTGFDVSSGLWQQRGWQELDALRKKLQELKELRELVRELGRGSGKGPLKKARAHVQRERRPLGVTRSNVEPNETRGLARSGDLSSLLPSEAAMLAGPGRQRLLVKQRYVERTLLTYERTGWFEDSTRVLDRMETRPSATRGPVMVCLDTSGSMMGGREAVAKALTLECLRQAHAQKRPCFLYAFSGPGAVQEMELRVDPESLQKLLVFLTMSFNGGTDVDEPLWRSLARLKTAEWADADMLLVTDGEIRPPNPDLITSLNEAKANLDLKVHGLLVGDKGDPEVMNDICSHVHEFKAWDKVESRRY
eukprot:CAMPEP_0114231982 /NCGR_PEP_ID=MMETSP0058-20121206/4352_1 /TAXON_ID=36894 /ORGANISM="Pyramimonas parkeae, CCMP726" /LENGTH=614 /DNA_ID=CAMNT_0001343403 /DNA_START=229 /DNA_END=2073 /DNA_ORIENTATION=+